MADFTILGEVRIDRSSIAREVRKISTEANNAFSGVRGIADQQLVQKLKGIGDVGAKSLSRITKEGLKTANTLEFIANQATVTARRFVTYQVIAGVFFRLTAAIGQGAQAFLDFNDAVVKSRQILNPLTSDINALVKSQFNLANAFGVTVTQVQEAQETFIRQGRSQAEVIELTNASLALSVAGGIAASQATETLTSAINQYNLSASKAIEISDKFTNVSIRNAVLIDDLDAGFRRAASAAKTVGVEINDLVGFITAIQEQTRRGGEVIGTSLRTIFTRLFRGPAIQAIEEVGISVRQLNGDFRSATDILRDLSVRFGDLTRAQQLNIGATIAGQRQIASFIALINNFEKAQKASDDALNASGTTAQLVQIRQEALTVQLQKARNEALQFGKAIGDAFAPTIVNTLGDLASILGDIGRALESLESGGIGEGILGALLKGTLLASLGKFLGPLESGISRVLVKTKSLATTFDKFTGATSRIRGPLEQAPRAPTRGVGGILNAGRFEAEKASFELATQRAKLDSSTLRVSQLKNQIIDKEIGLEKVKSELQANQLRLEGASLEFKVQAFSVEQQLVTLQEEQLVLGEQFTLAKQKQRAETAAQKAIENEIAIIEERKRGIQERINEQVRARNASLRAIRRAEDGIVAVEQRRLEIREQIASLSLLGRDAEARKLVEENVRLLEREATLRQGIADRQLQADQAAVGRDERRAELARVLTNLKSESVKLTEQEGRLAGVTAEREQLATQRRQQAGRITAQKNKVIALEEKFLQRINQQLEKGNISREKAARLLNQQRILAQELTEAEALRLATTEKVAQAEEKNTAAQERRRRIGGRAFGVAIAADIVGGVLAKFIRDLTDESDKGLRALADGVAVTTGAFTTFALLGAGPLGAIAGGLQLIIGLVGIFNGLSEDTEDVFERINSQLTTFASQLRAIDTLQNDLIANAKNLQAELSPENFRNLDAAINKLGNTFQNLDGATLARAAAQIRNAAEDSDFDGIRDILTDLRKQETIRLIDRGEIGALADTNRLIEEQSLIRSKIAETESRIARSRSDTERFNDFVIFNANLEEQNDLLDANEKALREQGQQAVTAFTASIDVSKNFDENIKSVGGSILGTLKATNQLNTAFEAYLRQTGLRITGSPIKQAQIDAEASLVTLRELQAETGKLNDLKLDNLLLQARFLDSTFQKNTATTFRLNDKLADNEEVLKKVATAFSNEFPNAANKTAKSLERILLLNERGELVFTALQDEAGNTTTTLQGYSIAVDSTTAKGKLLNDAIGDSVDVLSIGVQGFQSLRDALIPIDILLETLTRRLEASTKRSDQFVDATTRLIKAEAELLKVQRQSSALFPVETLERVNAEITRQVSIQSDNLASTIALTNAFSELTTTTDLFDTSVLAEIADIAEKGGSAIEVQNAQFDSFLDILGRLDTAASNSRAQLEKLGDDPNVVPVLNSITQLQTNLEAFQVGGNVIAVVEQFRQSLTGLVGQLDSDLRTQAERINETLEGQFKFRINLGADAETIRNQLLNFIQTISTDAVDARSPEFVNALRLLQEFIVQETQAGFTRGSADSQKNILSAVKNLLNAGALKQLEPVKKLLDDLGKTQTDNLRRLVDDSIGQLDRLSQAVGSTELTFPADKIERALNEPFENVRNSVALLKIILEKELKDVKARVGRGEEEVTRLRAVQQAGGQVTQQLNDAERDLATDRAKASAIVGELRVNIQKVTLADERRIAAAVALERKVNTLFDSTLQAQEEVIGKELEASSLRFQLIAEELGTTEQRIAAVRAEAAAADNLIVKLNDLENVNLEQLTRSLIDVSKRVQEETNPIIREALNRESIFLKARINAINESGRVRLDALRKELDLIRQQEDAIAKFGQTFITATEAQQGGFIDSARVVDKFFGQLTSQSLNDRRGTNAISEFITGTTTDVRAAAIEQLQRLESVGAEVAPGLSAGETLRRIGEVVGNAIFQSPQQAVLERQEQIQKQLLAGSLEQVNISKVNIQIQQALLKLAQVTAQKSLEALVGRTGERAGGLAGEATGAILIANESIGSVLGQNFDAAAQAIQDSGLIESINATINGISKSNKDFVDTFEGVSTVIDENALSADEFRVKIQELSAAILGAEEKVGQARVRLQDALVASADAMGKLTAANAEFVLGQRLVEIEAQRLFGTFTSVAQEAAAVNTVYTEQIRKLEGIFGAEQTLNNLRIKLLEEQTNIFENALNEQLSLGESFFAASREERAGLLEGFVGLENIVGDLDLQPGQVAGLGADELNQIGNSLLSLPDEFRQTLLEALDAVPGETTFGGVAADELRQLFAGAAFGADGQFQTPGDLQQQIVDANREIAQLSTEQLLAAQQTVFNTQLQVQEAQNQLQEMIAQKELAQLQLDALQQGFSSTSTIMNAVTAAVEKNANETTGVKAATEKVVAKMNELNQNVVLNKPATIQDFKDLGFFRGAVPTSAAAGGHLSLPEARGLLAAASREKRASPAGSRLGVFNTSETVLTKGQSRKLFGLGKKGLNAQEGTSIINGGEEVVDLLQQISNAITSSNATGGASEPIQIQIDNNRTVSVQGIAQLQTALQDIFSSRTDELYTREEGQAIERIMEVVVQQLRETGQVSVLNT
jgi:TP901 family phage tail tape measure protein